MNYLHEPSIYMNRDLRQLEINMGVREPADSVTWHHDNKKDGIGELVVLERWDGNFCKVTGLDADFTVEEALSYIDDFEEVT